MLVIAAYGCSRLWARVRGVPWKRRVSATLIGLCMGWTGFSMALNHPYQYVYYNPLIPRGTVNDYLERDYWNVSVQSALERLDDLVGSDSRPLVRGVDLWSQIGCESVISRDDGLNLSLAREEPPDFWLVNHTYQHYSHFQPETGVPPLADMAAAVQISAYGEPLVTVYALAAEDKGETMP
jgi:hypothetical protein